MCSKRRAQSIAPRTGAALDRTLDHVQNPAVVAIDHVDDARVAERAGIERLAAGRRIEGGAIEHDCELAGRSDDCARRRRRSHRTRAA